MTKQEMINELARLYRLQEEGKNVKKLIRKLEEKLCEACEEAEGGDEASEASYEAD